MVAADKDKEPPSESCRAAVISCRRRVRARRHRVSAATTWIYVIWNLETVAKCASIDPGQGEFLCRGLMDGDKGEKNSSVSLKSSPGDLWMSPERSDKRRLNGFDKKSIEKNNLPSQSPLKTLHNEHKMLLLYHNFPLKPQFDQTHAHLNATSASIYHLPGQKALFFYPKLLISQRRPSGAALLAWFN